MGAKEIAFSIIGPLIIPFGFWVVLRLGVVDFLANLVAWLANRLTYYGYFLRTIKYRGTEEEKKLREKIDQAGNRVDFGWDQGLNGNKLSWAFLSKQNHMTSKFASLSVLKTKKPSLISGKWARAKRKWASTFADIFSTSTKK